MATHAHKNVRSGWVGWVYFAGGVLLAIGIVHIVNGLIALTRSGGTLVAPSAMSVQITYAGVGWSFLIMGVVLAAAGGGVLVGRTWARAIAIALAVLSVLANLVLFTASPFWSSVIIVLDVVVIYALAAHGREAGRAH